MKKRYVLLSAGFLGLITLLYCGGILFLFEKPFQYAGRELRYHHEQLMNDGFSFLFKFTYPHGYLDTYQYIYKKDNLFNQPRYVVLTLESRESSIVKRAEKVAYVFWQSAYVANNSYPLADDSFIVCDDGELLNAFLPWKVPVAENESFLLEKEH